MSASPDSSSLSPLGLSWPVAVWISALLVLAAGNSMLTDPDTYWHVATGDWILTHGVIPHQDPYSHSMPGAPWTAHEWLSEVIFSLIHTHFGWSGLSALTAVVFATTLAGLTRFLLRHLEPVHALIFVALTAGMLKSHLLARPHLLAVPLLAIWLGTLVAARDRGAAPPLWLIPLMALWANLHGSFTFGIALAVALGAEATLVGGRRGWRPAARQWSLFVLLAIVASMLTPSHWKGLAFTFQVMNLGSVLTYIGEWRSPNFQLFNVFEIWLIMLLAIALVGRLKLPPIRLLMIVGMVHLSLTHQRYMAVTGVVAPLLIAAPFARSWYAAGKLGRDSAGIDRLFAALARPARRSIVLATGAISSLAIAAVVVAAPFTPDAHISPVGALKALADHKVTGPVFNAYEFGGFLIFEHRPVFIDGRADMYGEQLVERYVVATRLKSAEALTTLLDEYHIDATLLQPETPAVALLDKLSDWRRVQADEISVTHIRVSAGAAK